MLIILSIPAIDLNPLILLLHIPPPPPPSSRASHRKLIPLHISRRHGLPIKRIQTTLPAQPHTRSHRASHRRRGWGSIILPLSLALHLSVYGDGLAARADGEVIGVAIIALFVPCYFAGAHVALVDEALGVPALRAGAGGGARGVGEVGLGGAVLRHYGGFVC